MTDKLQQIKTQDEQYEFNYRFKDEPMVTAYTKEEMDIEDMRDFLYDFLVRCSWEKETINKLFTMGVPEGELDDE